MDNSRGRVNLSNISSRGVHSNNDKIKAYGSATWDSCREKAPRRHIIDIYLTGVPL